MIERALIQIAGPEGAGKTTLIAHLLGKLGHSVAAARCIRDDGLREPKESAPKGHPELKAYRAAGADPVALYRFPASHADWDAFWATDLMSRYFDAVLLEGDLPMEWVDLAVYVALPLPDREPLLMRTWTDPARERAAEMAALEEVLSDREEMGPRYTALSGLPYSLLFGNDTKALDALEKQLTEVLANLRRAPLPDPTERWALAEDYEGIQNAQVVVINVCDGGQKGAEPMLRDLHRLRADKDVFKDIFDRKGKRTPITAVTADLGDPRDPGLRKAIARIKRALPGQG
jgi:RecA/RadA recombinase